MGKRKTRALPQTKCLMPGCQRMAIKRGLCPGCHQGTRRRINLGKTTEAEAIKRGLMLPSRRGFCGSPVEMAYDVRK